MPSITIGKNRVLVQLRVRKKGTKQSFTTRLFFKSKNYDLQNILDKLETKYNNQFDILQIRKIGHG